MIWTKKHGQELCQAHRVHWWWARPTVPTVRLLDLVAPVGRLVPWWGRPMDRCSPCHGETSKVSWGISWDLLDISGFWWTCHNMSLKFWGILIKHHGIWYWFHGISWNKLMDIYRGFWWVNELNFMGDGSWAGQRPDDIADMAHGNNGYGSYGA